MAPPLPSDPWPPKHRPASVRQSAPESTSAKSGHAVVAMVMAVGGDDGGHRCGRWAGLLAVHSMLIPRIVPLRWCGTGAR